MKLNAELKAEWEGVVKRPLSAEEAQGLWEAIFTYDDLPTSLAGEVEIEKIEFGCGVECCGIHYVVMRGPGGEFSTEGT